jgi:hypothetical protein
VSHLVIIQLSPSTRYNYIFQIASDDSAEKSMSMLSASWTKSTVQRSCDWFSCSQRWLILFNQVSVRNSPVTLWYSCFMHRVPCHKLISMAETWTCPICTFDNIKERWACEMCGKKGEIFRRWTLDHQWNTIIYYTGPLAQTEKCVKLMSRGVYGPWSATVVLESRFEETDALLVFQSCQARETTTLSSFIFWIQLFWSFL